jgi:hypothetical protein
MFSSCRRFDGTYAALMDAVMVYPMLVPNIITY